MYTRYGPSCFLASIPGVPVLCSKPSLICPLLPVQFWVPLVCHHTGQFYKHLGYLEVYLLLQKFQCQSEVEMQSWDRPSAIISGQKKSILPTRNLTFVSPRTINTLPFALVRAPVTSLSFGASPVFRPNATLHNSHGMSHYKLTTFRYGR